MDKDNIADRYKAFAISAQNKAEESKKETEKETIKESEKETEELSNPKDKRTHNKAMAIITLCVAIIFTTMIVYMCIFIAFESKDVIDNPKNARSKLLEETIKRGSIYASDGKTVLAETIKGDNDEIVRYYPEGELFSNVVGRYLRGKTGIEKNYDYKMLTTSEDEFDILTNEFMDNKSEGQSINTTLNFELQKTAYKALEGKKGAIVAIEPSTGKLLAMVSAPTYDPNKIEENWDRYSEDSDGKHILLNRATQGLYPPGSTFKIETALEYMRENNDSYNEFSYKCTGSETFGSYKIKCYNSKNHGNMNLVDAFAYSCNTSFATIGNNLDIIKYSANNIKLLFNSNLPYEFDYKKSSFKLSTSADKSLIGQTAIGQGDTLITPLHNAMICSAVANDGMLMKTYVVDEIVGHDSKDSAVTSPTEYKRLMTADEADTLTKMMVEVINKGTGKSMSQMSCLAAGKTGSAEYNSKGDSHAWFVGFAPYNNPQIAVSVLVEEAGTGSESAVPIAKKLFEEYVK